MIEEKAKDILAFFGSRLAGYRHDQLAFTLSYANRRRLEIARAMATEPRLLLLDEPTAGMNPRETIELTELIGDLRTKRGFTVIVIEHDMRVVRDVSDRVMVLDHGVKIAEGSYDEISTNEAVIEAYLGRPSEHGDMSRTDSGPRLQGREHPLRGGPHPQRHRPRDLRRGDGLPARRQRLGEDHHPQDHPRATSSRAPDRCTSTVTRSMNGQLRSGWATGSRWSLRTAGSSSG